MSLDELRILRILVLFISIFLLFSKIIVSPRLLYDHEKLLGWLSLAQHSVTSFSSFSWGFRISSMAKPLEESALY